MLYDYSRSTSVEARVFSISRWNWIKENSQLKLKQKLAIGQVDAERRHRGQIHSDRLLKKEVSVHDNRAVKIDNPSSTNGY